MSLKKGWIGTPGRRVTKFFRSPLEPGKLSPSSLEPVIQMNGRTSQSVLHLEVMHAFPPLHDRVLVRRIEAEEKTSGGIIIPDTAKEKPQEGEVVAVGTGKIDDNGKKVEFTVKKGDKVLISKYGGTEIKVDGESYLIMREDDILGIIG